ncbi:adenosylhomocysteinase [Candidatus Bipolaricaulota bacterium]|nr:adenosylhomocysteinase [Candidatus Bipolaricaulota bacterium]
MTDEKGRVADPGLAPQGWKKIEWVKSHMPVMADIEGKISREKPFDGYKFGVSIHLEAKTARLALALKAGGGEVYITSSNPLSTQDDVAAALNQEENITVFSRWGVSEDEYEKQLEQVLTNKPDLIIDDGGDLVKQLHGPLENLSDGIIGGAEETTTGVNRLRVLDREGELNFPMFAVNDARMKYLFDNRYGTGQSTWDAITRNTNLTVAGSTAVVVGYGWCGKGIARIADGMGADVIVVEVDPVKALEAKMDGHRVMNIKQAAPEGDFFITSTGNIDAIPPEAIKELKDKAILANAGHFDVEIDIDALEDQSVSREEVRDNVERFTFEDGREAYLLAEGRLVNLAAGDGHPTEIMDISFGLQTLTIQHVLNTDHLENKLYSVPEEVDRSVAEMKLKSLGVMLDELTEAQVDYLENYS